VSAEENTALACRFIEARVKGNLDAVDDILAPDYVSHTKLLPSQQPRREGAKNGPPPNSLLLSPIPAYTSRTR
jgi:hypothetical protein